MAGLLSKGITLSYTDGNVIAYKHTLLLDADSNRKIELINDIPTEMDLSSLSTTGTSYLLKGGKYYMGSIYEGIVTHTTSDALDIYVHIEGQSEIMCGKIEDFDIQQTTVSTYAELTNLQEMAELGNNTPEKIDVTVLSDAGKKTINGLTDYSQDLAFKFLYEKEQFNQLARLKKSCEWEVTLPDGTKANFTATPSVKLDGVGVSAALTYTLTLSVESLIVFE